VRYEARTSSTRSRRSTAAPEIATLYGVNDRGLLAPGYLVDVNVIDHEALLLESRGGL
jgi:N-acyl-D-aspartate/D-glutamate deacylase